MKKEGILMLIVVSILVVLAILLAFTWDPAWAKESVAPPLQIIDGVECFCIQIMKGEKMNPLLTNILVFLLGAVVGWLYMKWIWWREKEGKDSPWDWLN